MQRQFDVIIERDSEGHYAASVPQLLVCHTQASSLDVVVDRIREAISLCLEAEGGPSTELEFGGHPADHNRRMNKGLRITGRSLVSVLELISIIRSVVAPRFQLRRSTGVAKTTISANIAE